MPASATRQIKSKAATPPAATSSPVTMRMVIPISTPHIGMSTAPKPSLSPSRIPMAPSTILAPFEMARQAIDAKYAQLGGAAGFMGAAVSDIQSSTDGVGYYVQYQGGTIYYSPDSDAHEVHGAIRDRFALLGGEVGLLGYPVTDETGTPDGVGRYNHFQRGSVYWTPATGAHEVHGAIRDHYASLGWERSLLGYPLTDETGAPDGSGRYNHFQGGSLYWSPATGAFEVHGAIRDKWASLGWERSFLGYPTTDELPIDLGPLGPGRISNFQNGSIAWTANTGAMVSPNSVHFHDVLTSGLPLGGWVDITMNAEGDVTFSGHLHNSGFDNIDYTLSVVVVSASGASVGFQHSGHTEGTVAGLPFGTPDRDDNFVSPQPLNNQQIAANWNDLKNGSIFWRLDATDTLAEGAGKVLGDLAQKAVAALGTAAVAALVALIFA